jgi:thiol-disulfide isomerase/thioredoxin
MPSPEAQVQTTPQPYTRPEIFNKVHSETGAFCIPGQTCKVPGSDGTKAKDVYKWDGSTFLPSFELEKTKKTSSDAANAPYQFNENNFNDARKAAIESGKPLVVVLGQKGNKTCDDFDSNTLPGIKDKFGDKALFVHVDAQSEQGKALKNDLKLKGELPCTTVLAVTKDGDGSRLTEVGPRFFGQQEVFLAKHLSSALPAAAQEMQKKNGEKATEETKKTECKEGGNDTANDTNAHGHKMSPERLAQLKAAKQMTDELVKLERQDPQKAKTKPSTTTEVKPNQNPPEQNKPVEKPDANDRPNKTPEKLEFSEGEIQQAIQAAKDSGRQLVIRVGAPWCPHCRNMDSSWNAKSTHELLNQKAIYVDVNADRAPNLVRNLGVGPIPATLVAHPDAASAGGIKVDQRTVGEISHQQLLNFLRNNLQQ